MNEGFVRLSRKAFVHYLWTEDRVFSRAEAWFDLIQSANFEDGKRIIKDSLVNVPRGGIVATERFLSGRWKWSRTKVRSFLDLLRGDAMIELKKDQDYTVIILCKYDSYNSQETAEKPPKNHRKTNGGPGEDQRKEGKEGKESSEAKASEGAGVQAGTDDEFLAELKADQTYHGIDVDLEAGKMRRWCIANSQKPSRKRFVNWLNKAVNDRPMQTTGPKTNGHNHPHQTNEPAHRIEKREREHSEPARPIPLLRD